MSKRNPDEDPGAFARALLEGWHACFRQKFGRAPGPDDPVFFDLDADVPRPISEHKIREVMILIARQAGVRESYVYAMRKTGMMILRGINDHLFTEKEHVAWQAALDEFTRLN